MESGGKPRQGVLIVGAGPTGLTAAAELYRHGVACRIVDTAPGPRIGSRGLAVHSRTLEVFEDMGILDAILAGGHRVYGMNAWADGKRIIHVGFDELDAPYPFIISLPQTETERILLEHLQALGGEVERSVTLAGLTQDCNGVTAELHHSDGREESATSSWLLGCDGAKSAARKGLGVEFSGTTYGERLVLADLTMDSDHPHDEISAFMSSEGICVAIPLPGEGCFRLVTQLSSEAPDVVPTLEWFQECARLRGLGDGVTLSNPTWLATLTIQERMVGEYRHNRVFLAGDAAHVHSPAGGQAMNIGIQDAYNLAWKLSLDIHHQGLPSLLESYQDERHPIAAQVMGDTGIATRVVMFRHPISTSIRNHLGSFLSSLEVVQRRVTNQVGQLAFNYRYSPIVGEERSSILTAKVGHDLSSEGPNLRNWLDFGAAACPGDRAPDIEFRSVPDDRMLRAFGLFQGPHHTLLLFDGWAPTEGGYESLRDLARRVGQVYGDRIKPYLIVPHSTPPKALEDVSDVILDPSGAFHARYGAGAECLYLIRPDNYVAFRAQPASEQALWTYLQTVFPLE